MNMAQTISERVTALAHSVRVDLRQGMSVVGLYILGPIANRLGRWSRHYTFTAHLPGTCFTAGARAPLHAFPSSFGAATNMRL